MIFDSSPAPPNVFHYFRAQLGRWPSDVTRDIAVDSDRGRKCVAAIDSACELWQRVRVASGDKDREHIDAVIAATDYVVTFYSRGL